MTIRSWIMTVLLFCQGSLAWPQTDPVLRVTESVAMPRDFRKIFGMFAKCDSQGSIYAPLADLGEAWGPVLRVSADGKTLTTFSLYSDPELAGESLLGFALGSSGSLHLLAGEEAEGSLPTGEPSYERFLIANMDAAGRHVSKISVRGGFRPLQFSVLPSGEFLIAGLKPSTMASVPGKPVVVLFDQQAKLIKELELEGGPHAPAFIVRVPGRPDTKVVLPDWNPDPQLDISLAEIDDDGTTYFLSFDGSVLVISPPLEQARLLTIPRPAGTAMMLLKVARGRLAVSFGTVRPTGVPGAFETVNVTYAILDPATLRFLVRLQPEKALLKTMTVCYSGETFTFLNALDPSGMKLLRATPK